MLNKSLPLFWPVCMLFPILGAIAAYWSRQYSSDDAADPKPHATIVLELEQIQSTQTLNGRMTLVRAIVLPGFNGGTGKRRWMK